MTSLRCCCCLVLGALLGLSGCGKPPQDAEPPGGPPPAEIAGGATEPAAPAAELQPGLAAAPANPDLSGKSILFISNANSPFWDAVDAGIKAGAEENGVEARLERNTEGSVEGQIKLLEQAIAQKDELLGVAISALRPDAPGILDNLKALLAAGVHVITVDSDCQRDAREKFIGTNNLDAGKVLGMKAAELKPEGAKCCVFVGDPSAQNAVERLNGFKEGAGDKFEVVDVYKDDVDPTLARSNVETALQAHPDATMLVGLWSYNGPAIAEVVQNAGKGDQITVVCFDAEPNLLPKLEAGQVAVTVVQKPYEFGRQGVKMLKLLATGDTEGAKLLCAGGDVMDTGVRVVTADTYAEFKRELDEKGLMGS